MTINMVFYNNHRAFFEPTMDLVLNIAVACVHAALHTNSVPNMNKLEFSFHTLETNSLPKPRVVEVPQFKTHTLPDHPLIVGIPVFHTLKPANKLNDLLGTFRRAYHSVRDKHMAPALIVRPFVAFALAFFEHTMDLVLNIAVACVQAALHTNSIPNMNKLEFGFHTLETNSLPKPRVVEVPQFKTHTLPDRPLIVGIPVFQILKPANKLNDLLGTFRPAYQSIREKHMAPVLIVCPFVAFALSRSDHVFAGILVDQTWLQDLQLYANRAFRAAFALPPWTANMFLHLPLTTGGVGYPSLPLGNVNLLYETSLQASVNCNRLFRLSATYLLASQAPYSERIALRTCLPDWRTRVHIHPFPHLHHISMHSHAVARIHPSATGHRPEYRERGRAGRTTR